MEMGSRPEADQRDAKRAIQVNGAVLKATDEKIDPEKDSRTGWAEGFYAQTEYFMLINWQVLYLLQKMESILQ